MSVITVLCARLTAAIVLLSTPSPTLVGDLQSRLDSYVEQGIILSEEAEAILSRSMERATAIRDGSFFTADGNTGLIDDPENG